MGISFQSKVTTVPSHVDSRESKKVFSDKVTFDNKVTKAETALKGFFLQYDDGDQNFGKETIGARGVSFDGKKVSYDVSCHFCDLDNKSSFHGSVNTLVLAETFGFEGPNKTLTDFRSTRITFDASPKSSRFLPGSIHFERPVKWAQAMLKNFEMEYVNTDQDFFLQRVGVHEVTIDDDVVNFEVYFQLEDVMVARGEDPAKSGKQVRGSVEVVVLAALES